MKLAYVVPRYGDEVVGGAELAVRMLAERIAARPGTEVEVLTTRAVDARSWANEYPEGSTTLRGVRVHRFTATGRRADFDTASVPYLSRPESLSAAEEQELLQMQGPVAPALVDAVRASDADLVVASPYLFDPVVRAIQAAPERAVLHPAAHDEAVLRLPLFREVFGTVRALVFYTHAEQHLVWRRFRVATTPQVVLGLGCDAMAGDEAAARARLGVGDRPYLLCLGRVEGAKGTDALARAFAHYKQRHPGPLALVFVGPVGSAPPAHPDVIVAGTVDDADEVGRAARRARVGVAVAVRVVRPRRARGMGRGHARRRERRVRGDARALRAVGGRAVGARLRGARVGAAPVGGFG